MGAASPELTSTKSQMNLHQSLKQGDVNKGFADASADSVTDLVRRLAMCQLRKSGNKVAALPRLHRKAFAILLGFDDAADDEVHSNAMVVVPSA